MIDLKKSKYDFHDLTEIMEFLRGENGCPWDREQTHASLRRDILEEAYEVIDAIDKGDSCLLKEELGDVLLNVVFHASIANQNGEFDMVDICDGVSRKMIYRHPGVFGGETISTSREVLSTWETLKMAEKSQKTYSDAINDVVKCLPALLYADKVQKKAKKAGFDWPDINGPFQKLAEETDELKAAIEGSGNPFEELGDLLFAAVNVARFLDIDPEHALTAASQKFVKRFCKIEEMSDYSLDTLSLEEMDKLWDKAKDTL